MIKFLLFMFNLLWVSDLTTTGIIVSGILNMSWNSSFFPFPASFLGAASRVAAGNLLGKKEKGKMSPSDSKLRIAGCRSTKLTKLNQLEILLPNLPPPSCRLFIHHIDATGK
jgi:hypothetical protein